MTERAYLHKDIEALTEEDFAEMREDLRSEEMEDIVASIESILNEIQPEAVVETFDAIIQAFKEYGEVRGKTAHEFFQDPDLPEILQRIQDRATELLQASAKKHNIRQDEIDELPQTAPYGPLLAMPESALLQFLFFIINSNGENLQASKVNRHEKITVRTEGSRTIFERKNNRKGASSEYVVMIEQAVEVMRKTGKTFSKCLAFSLEQMARQNFPNEVQIPLKEFVDRGSYSNVNHAKRAMLDFFDTQKQITLSGQEKRGRKTVFEEGGVLFYHYKYNSGGMLSLSVNSNFNWDLIAAYFTVFPRFAYALSNNAFLLTWYIFYLARQNTNKIREGQPFTIGLESVRAFIGLPDPAEVQGRKYRQQIMTPIEDAIEEIEAAIQKTPEAQNLAFTITPYGTDTKSITEYLQGYLEVGLSGAFAETFANIADNAEEKRKKWERAKLNAAAKLQAIEERKQGED